MNKSFLKISILTAFVFCFCYCSSTKVSQPGKHVTQIHVSAAKGDDKADGSATHPLKTISAATEKAMPGDIITVHAGVYREWVVPTRGGTDEAHRITYQAAPGEKVVITGSDVFRSWEKVTGNTWKLVVPNSYFGDFNPYAEKVHGDWFDDFGRIHRRGMLYLDGDWLPEADSVRAVYGEGKPGWFSVVEGLVDEPTASLVNVGFIKPSGGIAIHPAWVAERKFARNINVPGAGLQVGITNPDSWLRFTFVDFGKSSDSFQVSVASRDFSGSVEMREGGLRGTLLGTATITPTGALNKFQNFLMKTPNISGVKDVYFVFKLTDGKPVMPQAKSVIVNPKTTIYARFPEGTDPNAGSVEVCVRPTVFTPRKTGINYIILRGFDLRNAATNWAPPTMGQIGVVSAYWNKGWIIEDNEISYSRCAGVALGKYTDQWDGMRESTDGYLLSISDAIKEGGWSKDKIGSHIVRRNHIHHCGEVGIVGSMGCAFSRIEGNDIHDCNMQNIWSGAEQAGIKLHSAIDVVIADNHIWRNGSSGGLWLDWMAQGASITGNLFHDNAGQDFFAEADRGPFLVANNLFLSGSAYQGNSPGAAFVHNLVAGSLNVFADSRSTPFMKPHSAEIVGRHEGTLGDARWYNNILARNASLAGYNKADSDWVCFMSGNVFTKKSSASRFDTEIVNAPEFDTRIKLVKKEDGWYLNLASDPAWKTAVKRRLVTTALLGKAKITEQAYTHPDGSSISVDTDYFGKKRDDANPFPGAFETPVNGEIKVWPKKN